MTDIAIRPATTADLTLIIRFIRELAEYEKAPEQAVATEHQLEQALFCDNPRVYSVICEIDGNPAGFALFFYNFSTWLGQHGLFLEDLYVTVPRGTYDALESTLNIPALLEAPVASGQPLAELEITLNIF